MSDTYNASGYFNNFNAGKLSFLLDLNSERGQEIAYRLIERSDIFMTNFTPRVLEKWNLLYEHVSAANPRIVAGYAPMQGMVGPHRDFLGFGAVLTPITGISELSGFPHHPPIGIGTNYPDYVVNPGHLAFALLAALRHRDITGEGQLVEMPQIESVVNALAPAILDYTANGVVQTRTGNRSPVGRSPRRLPLRRRPHIRGLRGPLDRHRLPQRRAVGRHLRRLRPGWVCHRPALRHLRGAEGERGRPRDPGQPLDGRPPR